MGLFIHDHTGEQHDDGLSFKPGEEGFTRDLALAYFKGDKNFSYSGTPNYINADAKAEEIFLSKLTEEERAEIAAAEAKVESIRTEKMQAVEARISAEESIKEDTIVAVKG